MESCHGPRPRWRCSASGESSRPLLARGVWPEYLVGDDGPPLPVPFAWTLLADLDSPGGDRRSRRSEESSPKEWHSPMVLTREEEHDEHNDAVIHSHCLGTEDWRTSSCFGHNSCQDGSPVTPFGPRSAAQQLPAGSPLQASPDVTSAPPAPQKARPTSSPWSVAVANKRSSCSPVPESPPLAPLAGAASRQPAEAQPGHQQPTRVEPQAPLRDERRVIFVSELRRCGSWQTERVVVVLREAETVFIDQTEAMLDIYKAAFSLYDLSRSPQPHQFRELCVKFMRLLCQTGPPMAREFHRHLRAFSQEIMDARVYEARAAMEQREGDVPTAIRMLEEGLHVRAKPTSMLQKALQCLREDGASAATVSRPHRQGALDLPAAPASGQCELRAPRQAVQERASAPGAEYQGTPRTGRNLAQRFSIATNTSDGYGDGYRYSTPVGAAAKRPSSWLEASAPSPVWPADACPDAGAPGDGTRDGVRQAGSGDEAGGEQTASADMFQEVAALRRQNKRLRVASKQCPRCCREAVQGAVEVVLEGVAQCIGGGSAMAAISEEDTYTLADEVWNYISLPAGRFCEQTWQGLGALRGFAPLRRLLSHPSRKVGEGPAASSATPALELCTPQPRDPRAAGSADGTSACAADPVLPRAGCAEGCECTSSGRMQGGPHQTSTQEQKGVGGFSWARQGPQPSPSDDGKSQRALQRSTFGDAPYPQLRGRVTCLIE